MVKYKMVCSDLDGTLLNNNSKISRENLWAINELVGQGAYFVPSTGRAYRELPAELRENPAIRFIICSNGAMILDRESQKQHLICMSNQNVRDIFTALEEFEVHISMRQGGVCFADAGYSTEKAFDYYNLCQAHRVVLNDYADFRSDFEEFFQKSDDVEVISVFFHNKKEQEIAKTQLEKLSELRVVESFEYNLEIMSAKAGKGNALLLLLKLLRLEKENTISIGDSDNDSSIIEVSGLGLAVSNACESLKSIADEVICSNEEHAIDYVVKNYFNYCK